MGITRTPRYTEEQLLALGEKWIPHLEKAHGVSGPGRDGWADGDLRPYHLTEHAEMHRVFSGVPWRPVTGEQMLFAHPVTWLETSAPPAGGRWVYRDRGNSVRWSVCRFCMRAQAGDCAAVDCPLCGSRQCAGSSECRVCLHGMLPGVYRGPGLRICGYKGCGKPAVAKVPRVYCACLDCCVNRVRVRGGWVTGSQPSRALVPLTAYVEHQLAERDAGKGWQKWTWMP